MGCCGCCCRLLLGCLLSVVLLNVFLWYVPDADDYYIWLMDTYAVHAPPVRNILYLLQSFHLAFDSGVLFLTPVLNPRLVSATASHRSPGLMLIPDIWNGKPVFGYNVARVSHESIRSMAYNQKQQRPSDIFVTCNTTKTPPGYFPDGTLPTLLSLNTDDPRRLAHRDLLVATLDAIKEHPEHVPEFKAPAHISVEDVIADVRRFLYFPFTAMVLDKVQDIFAINFFRHLFGVDLTRAEIQTLKELTTVNAAILVNQGTETGGRRSSELFKVLETRLAASDIGRGLVDEAERRGMDGPQRLRKTLFEFIFAGFGGNAPGGALALFLVLQTIQRDPVDMVPLFKKDPDGFVLEVMRLRGGGGAGLNPVIIEETKTHKLPTGFEITEKKGDFGVTFMIHGNHDPEVFGGSSKSDDYARTFISGRKNADRILNFVSELRDIRKCPNMTGCEEAPRFCMGTFLTLRLNAQVGSWYVQGLEKELSKQEL